MPSLPVSSRLAVAVFVGLTACTTPPSSSPSRPAETAAPTRATDPQPTIARPPNFSRVVIVVMENKEYSEIIDSPDAPYVNSLARRHALATSFYGIRHPSLPNYLALTGGSTFGITSNCTSCHVAEPSIVDQLEGAGISWKAYMEGMPRPCYLGPAVGRYAKKHNPFVYYDRITSDARRCSKVVPLGELTDDLARKQLPRFVFITPDNCNNTHDCSVRHGDEFLARLLPSLLRTLEPSGVLFLTYDEGHSDRGCCSNAGGGRIVTIAAGPAAKPGPVSEPYTLYSILRTVEDAWGLPHLGEAGCPCTRSMSAMFRGE